MSSNRSTSWRRTAASIRRSRTTTSGGFSLTAPVPSACGPRPSALSGGMAVHVRERRVVVDRLGDLGGHGALVQEGLADVDELARRGAHDVGADELQRGPLEQQLQQPVRVAEDLGARVLGVVAAARHVVDPLLDERLLRGADVGDLGDRVDGEGQRLGAALGSGDARRMPHRLARPAPSPCWRAPGSRSRRPPRRCGGGRSGSGRSPRAGRTCRA